MQRRDQAKVNRTQMPRAPNYPTYTPSVPTTSMAESMDSYAAEKNRSKYAFQKVFVYDQTLMHVQAFGVDR